MQEVSRSHALTAKTLTSQQIYTGSPEPRHSNEISCAGSNGDLLLFCASSKGSGESAHLHRLTLASSLYKISRAASNDN